MKAMEITAKAMIQAMDSVTSPGEHPSQAPSEFKKWLSTHSEQRGPKDFAAQESSPVT